MMRRWLILLVACLCFSINSYANSMASFRFGTWNMEGATTNNEDIWSTAVRAMMTGFYNGSRIRLQEPGLAPIDMEASDIIALQEAGARPSSATTPTTPGWDGQNTQWSLQSNPNARVTEYRWNGWWLYHMPVARENQDPASGRRTNLAIVSRYRADGLQIVPRQMNEDNPGSLANRENFGIRVTHADGSQAWFYTFHASSFGAAAEDRNNVNPVLDRISIDRENFGGRWVVLGDYNRDPRNNGTNGTPSTGIITGVDAQRPIYYRYAPARATRPSSGRILDYAVSDHLVVGLPAMLVDELAQFSDHVPVVYQWNFRAAGEPQNQTYKDHETLYSSMGDCFNETDHKLGNTVHNCTHNLSTGLRKFFHLNPTSSWNIAKGMMNCFYIPLGSLNEALEDAMDDANRTMSCGIVKEKLSFEPPDDGHDHDEHRRRLRADSDHSGLLANSFIRYKTNHENVYSITLQGFRSTVWTTGYTGNSDDVFGRMDRMSFSAPVDEMDHYDPNAEVADLSVELLISAGGDIEVPAGLIDAMNSMVDEPNALTTMVNFTESALISADEHELDNGIAANNIDLTTADTIVYQFRVPANASSLQFVTEGTNGDADLYVRRGAAPTTSTYDCRGFTGDSNENCSFSVNLASTTTYYVMVRAWRTFSDVSVRAQYSVNGTPASINEQIVDISMDYRDWYYHSVYLGEGNYSSLNVTTSGGSGDADLYILPASIPTTSTFTCRSWSATNNESCSVSNPSSGLWYIGIRGWRASDTVTLNVTANP